MQHDVAALLDASGLLNGERRGGDWIVPAIVAASVSDRLETSLPKNSRAASRHAVDRERSALAEPHVVEIQLENLVLGQPPLERDRHEPLGQLPAQAIFSCVRNVFFTSCWVSVLPPRMYSLLCRRRC